MSDNLIERVYKKNELQKLEANTELYVEEKEAIAKLIEGCHSDAFIYIVRMINGISHERLMKKLSE